jgi:hypothetical protein
MTHRQPIFEPGRRYRAKKSFMSGSWTFIANEILSFKSDGYSRYDDCFYYAFHSETDGQEKIWLLREGKPVELWMELFEPLEKKGAARKSNKP